MNTTESFNVSFRCFYSDECGVHFTTHYNPAFALSDIPRWLDSYKFTHPNCIAISVKVWFGSAPDMKPCAADMVQQKAEA